jgi:hypothetical protein
MSPFVKSPAVREQNFISSFAAFPILFHHKIIDTPFYSDRMKGTQPFQPFPYSERRKGKGAKRLVKTPQGKLLERYWG